MAIYRNPWQGKIVVSSTVSCGACSVYDELFAGAHHAAAKEAISKGWKSVPSYGWLCPDCLKDHDAGRLDREIVELGRTDPE